MASQLTDFRHVIGQVMQILTVKLLFFQNKIAHFQAKLFVYCSWFGMVFRLCNTLMNWSMIRPLCVHVGVSISLCCSLKRRPCCRRQEQKATSLTPTHRFPQKASSFDAGPSHNNKLCVHKASTRDAGEGRRGQLFVHISHCAFFIVCPTPQVVLSAWPSD